MAVVAAETGDFLLFWAHVWPASLGVGFAGSLWGVDGNNREFTGTIFVTGARVDALVLMGPMFTGAYG